MGSRISICHHKIVWLIYVWFLVSGAAAYDFEDVESSCPAVPTAEQIKGHYAGFAIWHDSNSAHEFQDSKLPPREDRLESSSTSDISNIFSRTQRVQSDVDAWETQMDLIRASNRFWEAWAAKIQLKAPNDASYSIVTRGIRSLNSRSTFIKGTFSQLFRSNSILSTFLGGIFAPSSDVGDSLDIDFDSYVDGEHDEELVGEINAMDLEERSGSGMRCHISGTLERYSHNLKSADNKPIVESSHEYYTRGPDLLLRLMLSDDCRFPDRVLSIALRKFDAEFYQVQHAIIGLVVAFKTLAEILIYSRQYKQLESHRGLLKTSHISIGIGILYDSFEAQFFFSQQSTGSDMAVISPLSIVGLVKILLVCVVEMRWLITLWKERCIQRRHALGDTDPHAWVKDMNYFIRSAAAVMVLSLFLASHIFTLVPEMVMIIFCLFLAPQIIENIYSGVRHPLTPTFILGSLICRFVFPWMVWSATAPSLWRHTEIQKGRPSPAILQNAWPYWFAGPTAPKIPASFIDSVFGSVVRRPNAITLSIISGLMVWQGIHLLLQSWWSPRVGIPEWICARFLPVVFDYEVDVARVVALKQAIEPDVIMVDCVICFTSVKFNEKGCVVTPCEHFFHKGCLCKWMEVKLECPTCRRLLPPL